MFHFTAMIPIFVSFVLLTSSLCRSQGKITAQGKLLLQDTLQMMELSSKVKPEQAKFRERRVFLFEQIVIVSEEIEKRRNNLSNPGYIFKNSLKVIIVQSKWHFAQLLMFSNIFKYYWYIEAIL